MTFTKNLCLLFAFAVIITGCESGLSGTSLITASDGAKTVVITNSPGGSVAAFDLAFKKWSHIQGVNVEIQRRCASACTQVLSYFAPNQICLSPGARVTFHSVTVRQGTFVPRDNGVPRLSGALPDVDSIGTLMEFAGYPDWIQFQLLSDGVMGLGVGNPSATIVADEFWFHGYRNCMNSVHAIDLGRVAQP